MSDQLPRMILDAQQVADLHNTLRITRAEFQTLFIHGSAFDSNPGAIARARLIMGFSNAEKDICWDYPRYSIIK